MEIHELEENLNSQLIKDYEAQRDGFIQVGKSKWFYPSKFKKVAEDFKNFKVRPDDIWITGFPRSGTTLTEELVWQLSNNIDLEKAKEVPLAERVRFFELTMVLNEKKIAEVIERFPGEIVNFPRWEKTLKLLEDTKERRIIKTHLPFELLPDDVIKKKCKVIYICRYPKDVCVSFYMLQTANAFMNFQGDFEKYWNYFRNGHCTFGPYFEHVKQGFERIGSENFLFVFYEEFKKDTDAYINQLAEFLEVSISEEKMKELKDFIQIDNFRKVTQVIMKNKNNEKIEFVRKGKTGGWRDYFTEEMNEKADEWIEANIKRIGIKYPIEKSGM